MRRPRFRIRSLLIAVAVVGVGLGAVRWLMKAVGEFLESPFRGPHTSYLNRGQAVVIVEPLNAKVAVETQDAWGHWDAEPGPGPPNHLVAGTPGVIRFDSTIDEDSATDPSRTISVEIAAGPHKGLAVAVARKNLRKP